MADLTNILNGPWSPPPQREPAPVEDQLADAMRQHGMTPPDTIYIDGTMHRWWTGEGRRTDKTGWYVVFPDSVPAGIFGDWRKGIDVKFVADVGRRMTETEAMAHATRVRDARLEREAIRARLQEVVADTVADLWDRSQDASPDHPYLARKGIQPHGARVAGDGRLMLPVMNQDGTLSSVQYIDANGGKLYHKGGGVGGKYWMLGTLDKPGPLFIAEGFATAASIHEATGRPCVVAYSANNLVPVTAALREACGVAQEIVIVADNDESGVGQRFSEQAGNAHGARVVVMPTAGDANDYAQAGHDLSLLLMPQREEWLIPADDFSAQPAPISWLVKRWLQDQAMIMVHGPSGGGKTFVVLDWCLRMASGTEDWCGHKVRPGNVVYLAGEGHHGLRGRIAAWKHYHQCGPLSMWLSKDGCDLNTPAGYVKVVEQVRSLPSTPSVIVVDTLHRFLAGDENSAQDAKTMLDACGGLMREFGCSVILVHHTGVAEDAQHRARGSSAWRGALDIEISIVPGKDGQPMQIVQRKSKDAELCDPVQVELHSVAIPGWYDEDGEPVTSAVVVQSEAPPPPTKKESKLDGHRRTWENAWWASGAEERDGMPYLSRSALMEKLVADGNAERTARNMTNPSYDGKLICLLLQAEMIKPHEHGWIMADEAQASAMMMRKNS